MKKTSIFTQFIDGSFTESSGRETFTTLNPATNGVLGVVARASESDIESAIASAQKAFSQWRHKTGAERGRVLTQAARILRSRCQDLAHLEMQDVGKPISETLTVDIGSAADALEYFGGLAAGIHGNVFDLKNRIWIYTPGAAWCLRGHWCMELPASDRCLESSAGTCLWQCHDL